MIRDVKLLLRLSLEEFSMLGTREIIFVSGQGDEAAQTIVALATVSHMFLLVWLGYFCLQANLSQLHYIPWFRPLFQTIRKFSSGQFYDLPSLDDCSLVVLVRGYYQLLSKSRSKLGMPEREFGLIRSST
jgi:hypothetical protein